MQETIKARDLETQPASLLKKIQPISLEKDFLNELVETVRQFHAEFPKKNITVLLPSKRATKICQTRLQQEVSPKVKCFALGDIDLNLLEHFQISPSEYPQEQPLSTGERLFLLSTLIQEYPCQLRSGEIQSPSFTSAFGLAKELSHLLDELYKEHVFPINFEELIPERFAKHWQQNLHFLKLINEHWLPILKEKNKLDLLLWQQKILKIITQFWHQFGAEDVIILAGSSLSQKMIYDFASELVKQPHSHILFYGLDKKILEAEISENTNPFYYIRQFIDEHNFEINCNEHSNWQSGLLLHDTESRAVSNNHIHCLEANHFFDEASAVRSICQRAVHEKKTVTIISQNQQLKDYLYAELSQHHIEHNLFTQKSYSDYGFYQFQSKLLECVRENFSAVSFLSLLKDKHFQFDQFPLSKSEFIARLEEGYLRGPWLQGGLKQLLVQVKELELNECLTAIAHYFQPILDLYEEETTYWVDVHFQYVDAFADEVSESFRGLLEDCLRFQQLSFNDYVDFFHELGRLSTATHDFEYDADIQIVSSLEARLLKSDIVILTDMNEGSWPKQKSFSPWLNQAMAQQIGLWSIEKAFAQSKLDFIQQLACSEVYLTRSKTSPDGSPSELSRWVLHLDWYSHFVDIHFETIEYQKESHAYDYKPCKPPLPKPPLAYRPQKFSVTKVEQLMRDPYGFYVEKILKLKPLAELEELPNQSQYGQFVHKILEDFFAEHPHSLPADAEDILLERAERLLRPIRIWPQLWSFWMPRLQNFLPWLVKIEQEKTARKRTVEIEGRFTFKAEGQDYVLTAKADRIDLLETGGAEIIDYKTGSLPSTREMEAGFSPQLPLEGAIFFNRGFDLEYKFMPDHIQLSFYRLRGDHVPGELMQYQFDQEACEKALDGWKGLMKHFANEHHGYPSQPSPEHAPKYSAYDHLSRIQEWKKG